jgi:Phospholipase B
MLISSYFFFFADLTSALNLRNQENSIASAYFDPDDLSIQEAKLRKTISIPIISEIDVAPDLLATLQSLNLQVSTNDAEQYTISFEGSLLGDDSAVRLQYNRTFSSIGWNTVNSFSECPLNTTNMYLQGYMEALCSPIEIYQWFTTNTQTQCNHPRVKEILKSSTDQTLERIQAETAKFSNQTLPLAHLFGLIDGYNKAAITIDPKFSGIYLPSLSFSDFLCLNLESQLSEIVSPVKKPASRCSAVVGLLPDDDNSSWNPVVAHTTWETLPEMVNKTYRVIHSGGFEMLQYSTYPGMVWSSDDWYVKNSDFVVVSTSLNLVKPTKTSKPSSFGGLPFIEISGAILSSSNAFEFARKLNSTAQPNLSASNSQWIAVDLENPSAFLVESGGQVLVNITDKLRETRKFGSFNTPYSSGNSTNPRQDELSAQNFTQWYDLYWLLSNNIVLNRLPTNDQTGGTDVKIAWKGNDGVVLRSGIRYGNGTESTWSQIVEKLSGADAKLMERFPSMRVNQETGNFELFTIN